jgi:hypothetical protein
MTVFRLRGFLVLSNRASIIFKACQVKTGPQAGWLLTPGLRRVHTCSRSQAPVAQ